MALRISEGGAPRLTESGQLRIVEPPPVDSRTGSLAVTEADDTLAATATIAGPSDTWNSADKGAQITLSNGDLTATRGAGGSAYQTVRTIGSRSTGKLHFECACDLNVGFFGIGVGSASAALTNYLGSDGNGIGYYSDGSVWRGGSNQGSAGSYTTGGIPEVEVDLDARTIKFRPNNAASWSSDFALNGGMAAADLHAMWNGNGTGDQGTLNVGASAFDGALSSGYSAWG